MKNIDRFLNGLETFWVVSASVWLVFAISQKDYERAAYLAVMIVLFRTGPQLDMLNKNLSKIAKNTDLENQKLTVSWLKDRRDITGPDELI